jgi:hypothetical protein
MTKKEEHPLSSLPSPGSTLPLNRHCEARSAAAIHAGSRRQWLAWIASRRASIAVAMTAGRRIADRVCCAVA